MESEHRLKCGTSIVEKKLLICCFCKGIANNDEYMMYLKGQHCQHCENPKNDK